MASRDNFDPVIPLQVLDAVPVALAFLLALALTPLVRTLARRWGMIARPKSDRWHQQPTALLGGVAIFLAAVLAGLIFLPRVAQGWLVLAGGAWLFLVGLVDDLWHIRPFSKLMGQLLGAGLVAHLGLLFPWTGLNPLDKALTVFWLVGITNALNLLDNMDGLSAGVAAIAAAFFAAHFLAAGQTAAALAFAGFAAALLGFLVYNAHPASIFMGDSGSLFIGFFLAGGALLRFRAGAAAGPWPDLAVPVLILAVPIFDTTLVTIVRKLSGRAVSQGGRDHSSHRLVALGLSERAAVWTLYGLTAISGGLSFLVERLELPAALIVVAVYLALLTGFGLYLARVPVYQMRPHP